MCWPKTVKFGTLLAATFSTFLLQITQICGLSQMLLAYWRDAVTSSKRVYYMTFKITMMLYSFNHTELWQCTTIFTVSFTVSVQYVLLVTRRRVDALEPATSFIDGAVVDHTLKLLEWVVACGTPSVEGHPKQRKAYTTIAIGLRYDYDTTTTKKWHVHFARVESRRMETGARDTS